MTTSRSLRRRRGAAEPPVEPAPTGALMPRAVVVVGTRQRSPEPTVDSVADDPAELAEAARLAAAAAREAAARTLTQAQAEAQRILDEAQAQAAELERTARDADAEAAAHQAIADRSALIVSTSAEVETLTAARDRLAAEARDAEADIDRLEVRLQELGAEAAEARQRRVMAVRSDDAGNLRDAFAALATAEELREARTADLSVARSRLAGLRADHEEVCDAFGKASLRLIALRRTEQGRPPAEEIVAVTMGLLPALVIAMMHGQPEKLAEIMLSSVPEDQRPMMVEAIRLGPRNPQSIILLATMAAGTVLGLNVLAAAEQLALIDPAQYAVVRRGALGMPATAPPRQPADDAAGMVRAALTAGGAR